MPRLFYVLPVLQARDQLTPAEKALRELAPLPGALRPTLDQLRDLLRSGNGLAVNATEEADRARAEADRAARVRSGGVGESAD